MIRGLLAPAATLFLCGLAVLFVLKGRGLAAVALTLGALLVMLLPLDLALAAVAGVALFSAFGPNAVYAFLHPEEFHTLWNTFVVRGVNYIDLGFAGLGLRFIFELARKRIKLRRQLLDKPLWYLSALVVFGALVGLIDRGGVQRWSYWFWSIRIFLYFFFFYFVCSRAFNSFREVRRFVWIILAVLAARWLYTSLDSLLFNPTDFESVAGLDALFFNETAGLVIPVAVMCFIFMTQRRSSTLRTLLSGLMFAAIVVSEVVSGRRGGVLMILLGVASYLLTAKSKLAMGRTFTIGLIVISGFILFVATKPAAQDVVISMVDSVKDPTRGMGERISEIQNVAENLNANKAWAYGLGLGRAWHVYYNNEQFSAVTAFSDDNGRGSRWLFTVHVPLLDILLFFGWGGAFLYLLLWYRIGKAMRSSISLLPLGEGRTLAQALFCGLISLFPFMTLQVHLVICAALLLGSMAALLSAPDLATTVSPREHARTVIKSPIEGRRGLVVARHHFRTPIR